MRQCALLPALALLAVACAAPAGQVHLSLGDAPDELRVLWATDAPTRASLVEYAPLSSRRSLRAAPGNGFWLIGAGGVGEDSQTVVGEQWRFAVSTSRSMTLHKATLRGLTPGVSYRYRVGSGDLLSWSPRFTFRAPRQRGDGDAFRFLAFCDAGEVDDARAGALNVAAQDAEQVQYDALLSCGDFAYDLNSEGGRRGDRFMSRMQPLTATLPYLVSPGNHEVWQNFSAFRNRFAGMPGRGAAASQSLYWSSDVGPVHVVSYNTEVYFWPELFTAAHASQQYAWLAADLAAADANRAAVPWIVVMGHRPMYCVAVGADGRCDAEHEASRLGTMMQCNPLDGHTCWGLPGSPPPLSVEQLLYKHGVDVAFFGHVHAYARHLPVYDEQPLGGGGADAYVDPRATVHFTTGAAGNPEMKLGTTPPPLGACSAPWCAFQAGYAPREGQSADYSYSRLTVANATHLRWEQVSATVGGVIDDTWIVRTRGVPAFGAAAAARAATGKQQAKMVG